MGNLVKQLGKQIRVLRKNRGLTQEKLGEEVQLPQSYIGNIERGEKNISIETLERIVKTLNIRPSELFETYYVTEKENTLDQIKVLLEDRSLDEIKLIYRLTQDVLKIIESK